MPGARAAADLPAGARVVPPPEGTRGILLDVDDTLLGTRAAMLQAGSLAARELWPAADPSRLREAGRRFREDPAGHFRAYTRGEHDFGTMRALRVRDLARWLGARPAPEDAERWSAHYERAFAEALRAFDDVLETLRSCRGRGWAVALLTNSAGDYTRAKLRVAGLEAPVAELTAGVVTRDTLGVGKPAPQVFHHACALMRLQPGEVVYVGDELDVDTCAALAAGLGAAWLRRPGYEVDDAQVAHAATHGLVAASTLAEVLEALGDGGGFGSGAGAR